MICNLLKKKKTSYKIKKGITFYHKGLGNWNCLIDY